MNDTEELERLEVLYKHVIPVNLVQITEKEDQAVINLARNHLHSKYSRTVVPIHQFRRAKIKWASLSIAAGLLIGIMLNPNKINSPSMAPSDDGHIVRMGENISHQQNSVNDLEADELQTLIAETVLKGEFEKAAILLDNLTDKYPEYGSD